MTDPLRADPRLERKARGAFFTPQALCRYVVEWAIRSPTDDVLEPSCGEAAFLLAAGDRLETLAQRSEGERGRLDGVELHEDSAREAEELLAQAGHIVRVTAANFFAVPPTSSYDVVVGNPPYVRYQDFAGQARARSRAAALRAGVSLTGLASSWAAFTIHSALFLRPGGRLGLVLPAELLTVNYAAEVRRFLMERFRKVRLVLFNERVFPGVLEEVVLVLAEGYSQGPAAECELHQMRNAADLVGSGGVCRVWKPHPIDGKWTPSLMATEALEAYISLESAAFTRLQAWGETTLGMVTGNNRYFALNAQRVAELGLAPHELLPLSPPGSRHLRGLTYSPQAHQAMITAGARTFLFRPAGEPSRGAWAYLESGEQLGVHQAYKCRVRSPWWRVPLVKPPDLFLTYMNADTPRLCTNRKRAHHLNSVHGVYLRPEHRGVGLDLLALAALTSMTLVGAETVGRAYGGGMLKLEPKEADLLPVPSPAVVEAAQDSLRAIQPQVAARLRRPSGLLDAVKLVDDVLLVSELGIPRSEVKALREAHGELSARRVARGGSVDRGSD